MEVQGARVSYHGDLVERWTETMDVCSYNFWFYCTLLDPRFKSFRNILGLTATDKTEARASFDSLYRSHWAKDMEHSVSDSDETEDMNTMNTIPQPLI